MKTLRDYLVESKKTYAFKIGIAGELPDGIDDKLKTALAKFSIHSLSASKKTPIQERPMDFPNLENTEVTFWHVEINYPTIESVLQEYIGNFCSIEKSHIIVRNPDSPVELQKAVKDETVYEPLLTKDDVAGESAQDSVGQSRLMSLLKELEIARKESNDQSSGFKIETLKKDSQNNKSVVGK